MRNVYDLRRDNLRELSKTWGGPTSLSRKLGHTNGSYLAQLIGPHPSRSISEKVAREVEGKLGLALGWLDEEHNHSATRLDDDPLDEVWKVSRRAMWLAAIACLLTVAQMVQVLLLR